MEQNLWSFKYQKRELWNQETEFSIDLKTSSFSLEDKLASRKDSEDGVL